MSGGRWRLQRVDENDEGWEAWQVCVISEDDSEVVLQAFDEKWAKFAITAMRWWDSFQEQGPSIPKPKPATRKRTTRSKA